MKKYWWFSDYDGTLSHGNNVVKEDVINFINKFKKENTFCIATGNMLQDMKENMPKEIEYEYIVTNGCCVYDKNDNLVFANGVDKEDRVIALQLLEKYKKDTFITYNLVNERLTLSDNITDPEIKNLYDNLPYFRTFLPEMNNYEENLKIFLESDIVAQISVWGNDEKNILIMNEVNKHLKNSKMVRTHKGLIEVISLKGSKKDGILYIANKFGVPMDKIIVSGDGDNDLSMFTLTNNSFAMKNGTDNVKEKGTYIVESVCEIENYIK